MQLKQQLYSILSQFLELAVMFQTFLVIIILYYYTQTLYNINIKQTLKTMNQKLTPTVMGIDIGASSAKLAAVLRGAVDVITNQANFRETPCIVGYGEGQRKIGELGSVKLKSNFKNTVVSPTRYLGLANENESIRRQLQNCPCTTSVQGQNLLFKVAVNEKSQSFTSQQVLASFMTQINTIIQHNNLDPKLIMFSVPSFYTQIQKTALLNAAEISGLKNSKLVTQGIAIGLDYGSFKKSQLSQGKNVVFIDFGHSKLSVSLIKFIENKMEIVLQNYNRNLGCRNIDKKVFQYFATKFQQKKGLNLRQSKRACLKLLEAIQKQRKILSSISETDLSIQCIFEDQDLLQTFTRQTLLNQSVEVFNQISTLLKNFKEEIQKLNIKIDSIELVGGGSRIPKFVQVVESVFGIAPSRTTNSNQTIARGATLRAVQNSGLFRFDTFQVHDRSSHPILLKWGNQQNKQNSTKLIQFNEDIPCEKSIKIKSEGNIQILVVYENLDKQLQNRIMKINCQGSKDQINLVFSINENQFISVKSVKNNQGQQIKFSVELIKQLSSQQMLSFKAKQRQMFVKDFSILRSYQKKNQLQSFIYKQKETINNEDFKKYLCKQQIQMAEKYLVQITQNLSNQDNKMGIKDYETKIRQVQGQIKKLADKAKHKRLEILQHFKQLQKLKNYAADVMKQIAQTFRNSKPVAQTYQSIKQIYQWAQQAIKISKSKQVKQLPVVKQEDLKQQYENIKILYNNLVNPQKSRPDPRHQKFQQRYDPNQFMRGSWFGPQRFYQDQQQLQRQRQAKYRQQRQKQQQQQRQRQAYYQRQRQRQEQQQRQRQAQYMRRQQQMQRNQKRKQQQQRQYDPFGMSRSGYFGPSNNNFFGGFF